MVVSFILYPLPHPEGRGLRGILRSAALLFEEKSRVPRDFFLSSLSAKVNTLFISCRCLSSIRRVFPKHLRTTPVAQSARFCPPGHRRSVQVFLVSQPANPIDVALGHKDARLCRFDHDFFRAADHGEPMFRTQDVLARHRVSKIFDRSRPDQVSPGFVKLVFADPRRQKDDLRPL